MSATVGRFDVVVVGAGIVGLASALRLLERHPGLRLLVVDKEQRIAHHQTGRNSGVVHRGVYYAPGSLKARLCVQGAVELVAFCERHDIRVDPVGKVIVALEASELPALHELHRRGIANGVPNLELIDEDRLREIEPHAAGIAALHSPQTAVVDFVAVAHAYARQVEESGGEIRLGRTVLSINERSDAVTVETDVETVHAAALVACAGLYSDRLAAMTDPDANRRLRIVPFRGDYYVLRPERRFLVRGLVYPVADPRFPFLGVHFTVRHDGEVWAGPNAVLAFGREGYRRLSVSPSELWDTLSYRGFWEVARRYWRVGAAEMWRDFVKSAFVSALRRYIPEVQDADLLAGPSGVRAQAVAVDGSLVDDFVVERSARSLHVRNAPSPAATSSLAIASLIADRAEQELGVGA
jgi:(S)-2-hydroxyglutarate dehydrogenase